jgi:hypothetical protein
MDRLTAYLELRLKQTKAVEARWRYTVKATVTHRQTDAEPWTCGRMELTREHRSTGAVRFVASREYQESRDERRAALAIADELTQRWTAFADFTELVTAQGGYRPSLRASGHQTRLLADYYDAAQIEIGDPRRAYRS